MSIDPAENDRNDARSADAAASREVAHRFSLGMALRGAGSISGVTTWGRDTAVELAKNGWHSIIFEETKYDKRGPTAPTLTGVNVVRVPYTPGESDDAERISGYRQALPAVFIPNASRSMYPACALLSRGQAARMRVVGICHSFEDFYFEILRYYEPIIHLFVAVSEECADALRQLMPDRRDEIRVRPYGIRRPYELRREYAKPDLPLRLLYAGRVVEQQKRVLDLLKLAEELGREHVNFELRIVGEGQDKPQLQRAWKGLDPGIRARVHIQDGIPAHRIADLFLDADVIVLVSAYEGTSVFMLEGMAHGCVPVVTRVSGTAGTVSPGVTGFVHPVGDLRGMAASIRQLDADRTLLARVGCGARAQSRQFDMDDYVPWFERCLVEAWEKGGPRVWPAGRPIRPEWLQVRQGLLVRFGKRVPWARRIWRRCRNWWLR